MMVLAGPEVFGEPPAGGTDGIPDRADDDLIQPCPAAPLGRLAMPLPRVPVVLGPPGDAGRGRCEEGELVQRWPPFRVGRCSQLWIFTVEDPTDVTIQQ